MASWSTRTRPSREIPQRLSCMTLWTLVRRSLRFHARAHLGVVLGAAVGSAALIGALVVGDSVRGSLEQMAMARLGKIQLALASNDRFFRGRLADDLQLILRQPVAPALQVSGMAVSSDASARANRVQVLGVDDRFWQLANRPPGFGPTQSLEGVVLNQSLAQQLKARPGDEILLRVEKPSSLSREAPISSQQDSSVALRVPVRAVVSDQELGRFSLQASQVAPFNAFLPLRLLQQQLAKPGQANLLLVARSAPRELSTLETSNLLNRATAALRSAWDLADSELDLREMPSMLELRSRRVFLEAPIVEALRPIATNPVPVLTYFVNELRVGSRSTPYSMVTGMRSPLVPPEMKDNEVIVNSWLAEDLQALSSMASAFVKGLCARHRRNLKASGSALEARGLTLREFEDIIDCSRAMPAGFWSRLDPKDPFSHAKRIHQEWVENLAQAKVNGDAGMASAWHPLVDRDNLGRASAKELMTGRALFEEGSAMHHCVSSYSSQCQNGGARIVSLSLDGARSSTLELAPHDSKGNRIHELDFKSLEQRKRVNSWKAVQHRGKCNAAVKHPELLALASQIEARATASFNAYTEKLSAQRKAEAEAKSASTPPAARPLGM